MHSYVKMESKQAIRFTLSAQDAFASCFIRFGENYLAEQRRKRNEQSGNGEPEVTAVATEMDTLTLTDTPQGSPP